MRAAWFEGLLFFAAIALAVYTVRLAWREIRSPGGPPPSGHPGPDDTHRPVRDVAANGPGRPTTRRSR